MPVPQLNLMAPSSSPTFALWKVPLKISQFCSAAAVLRTLQRARYYMSFATDDTSMAADGQHLGPEAEVHYPTFQVIFIQDKSEGCSKPPVS